MRLAEVGEFGLLAELESRGLVRGIGDDAAVVDGVVVTQDMLVERVHFRLEWTSWRDLGYKAAAVNLSDLAAMGAVPRGLLVSLALPRDLDVDVVYELYEGLAEAGFPVLGGDTSAAREVAVSATALGVSERVPGRAGAVPGDALVVTGPLGGAAAGLYTLEHGLEGFGELVRAHLRPPFRLDAARVLAPVAHALIDLSDGIASDAARIAERSRCRLVIDVDRLPLAPRLAEVADLPFWTRGEDYELLAALAPTDADSLAFPTVGRCDEGTGVELRLRGEPLAARGWDHFRP
ncbi:MAG: thiamine-phosphate kinase [Actinomycetota bacterium]|nr:thiamine-phosphate kinase [Actinomycetota bacterium]